jgi:hypothetical protein
MDETSTSNDTDSKETDSYDTDTIKKYGEDTVDEITEKYINTKLKKALKKLSKKDPKFSEYEKDLINEITKNKNKKDQLKKKESNNMYIDEVTIYTKMDFTYNEQPVYEYKGILFNNKPEPIGIYDSDKKEPVYYDMILKRLDNLRASRFS